MSKKSIKREISLDSLNLVSNDKKKKSNSKSIKPVVQDQSTPVDEKNLIDVQEIKKEKPEKDFDVKVGVSDNDTDSSSTTPSDSEFDDDSSQTKNSASSNNESEKTTSGSESDTAIPLTKIAPSQTSKSNKVDSEDKPHGSKNKGTAKSCLKVKHVPVFVKVIFNFNL